MNRDITANNTALLLIDHQSGLFQTVKDINLTQLVSNVSALGRTAKLLNIPIITTASVPEGPNGPLINEVKELDDATFIPRNGEVNAWDAPAFPLAVESTGKNNLIIAGVWTSVCVAFPSLSALSAGYNVYAVIDASGDVSTSVSQIAMIRLAQAGVTVTTTNSIISALQKTWDRNDASEFAEIYCNTTPSYALVMESFIERSGN